MPETKGLPYCCTLKELDLPTLKNRRQRTDIIQTFKIMKVIDSVTQVHKCSLCPSKKMFSKETGTRGHSEKLHVQRTTDLRHRFVSIRVINTWNPLSEDMIQATTVNHLKSLLRREWRDHPDLYSYHFTNETNRNNKSNKNSKKRQQKNQTLSGSQ